MQSVSTTITQAQYEAFQRAYDFFNAELFAGALPNVLVTMQRQAKADSAKAILAAVQQQRAAGPGA